MTKKKFKLVRMRNSKAEALARLKAYWAAERPEDGDEEEWSPEAEPEISPYLRSSVLGGIPKAIEALRFHEEEDAQAFLECWDSRTATDRRYLRIEDVAHASGIGSLRLAEMLQTALYLYGERRINMLFSTHLPAVVEKSLSLAQTDKGVYDREMMLKAGKILPVNKNAQSVIINNAEREPERKPGQANPIWKDSGQRLREFYELTDPKRLPSPAAAPAAPGGHISQLQEQTAELLQDE